MYLIDGGRGGIIDVSRKCGKSTLNTVTYKLRPAQGWGGVNLQIFNAAGEEGEAAKKKT